MFAKYGDEKDGLSKWAIFKLMSGQRVLFDPFGTFGALFECRCCLWLVLRFHLADTTLQGTLFTYCSRQRTALCGRTT